MVLAGLWIAEAAELVMVEQPGCPWCARWHAEIGPVYPNTAEGRRAPLRRMLMSDVPASDIRLAQPVTVSPTFVLIENGQEIGRITGYPGPDFFWGLLSELLLRLPQTGRHSRGVQGDGQCLLDVAGITA